LDELTITSFKDHHVLLIAPAESAMFVQSYLDEFPQFSKERIKQDLIKALKGVLEHEPYNLPAAHSLKVINNRPGQPPKDGQIRLVRPLFP
jgi:hypothetical protein